MDDGKQGSRDYFSQDHGYALPSSPTALKTRLNEALARVESLERVQKNAVAREKRAKTTVRSLLGDLKEKNLINEELKEKLEFYSVSDLQVDPWQNRVMSTLRTVESLHSHSICTVQRRTTTLESLNVCPSHIPIHYKDGCGRWMINLA